MRNKWLLFVVLYFAALCVSLSQLKFVTVMGVLAQGMELSMTQVTWLMSVFTLAGVVLAIPGGMLLSKLGPKKLLLMLMLFLFVGNIMGMLSTDNYMVLLVSRALEGVAFAMIIMNGIVLISGWFSGPITGTAIGIFTTFPALGSVVAFNVSVPVFQAFGLTSLWTVTAILTAAAFVLVLFVIPEPKADPAAGAAAASAEPASLGETVTSGRTWLLAIGQGCVAFVLFTFITIYPSLFTSRYGLDPTVANGYASLNGLFGIPFCIIGGAIIARFKQPAVLLIISFAALAVASFMTSRLGGATYIVHTFCTGVFTGLIIAGTLAIAPGAANRPANIGYTVAIINLVYYLGIFIGAPAVMSLVEKTPGPEGWNNAGLLLAAVSILGLVTSLVTLMMSKKKA